MVLDSESPVFAPMPLTSLDRLVASALEVLDGSFTIQPTTEEHVSLSHLLSCYWLKWLKRNQIYCGVSCSLLQQNKTSAFPIKHVKGFSIKWKGAIFAACLRHLIMKYCAIKYDEKIHCRQNSSYV